MEILEIRTLRGPNYWSGYWKKLIIMRLDIGEYEDMPTDKLDGFYERMADVMPSLISHGCSYQEEGGFMRRVKEGTWAGHVIEHFALEYQTLAGMDTGYGRTRETDDTTALLSTEDLTLQNGVGHPLTTKGSRIDACAPHAAYAGSARFEWGETGTPRPRPALRSRGSRIPRRRSRLYKYKVVEVREKMIGGKMSGEKLERLLNDHARDGWQLRAITAVEVRGRVGPGGVDGLLVTFERNDGP